MIEALCVHMPPVNALLHSLTLISHVMFLRVTKFVSSKEFCLTHH